MNRRDFFKKVTAGGTAIVLSGGLASKGHGYKSKGSGHKDKHLKGKNIDIMHTLSGEVLNVQHYLWHGADIELIKGYKPMRDYSIKGLFKIIGFLNGEKPILEKGFSIDSYIDTPFRLALYTAANSRVVDSWPIKGSTRKEHAKEYRITPEGEPTKGDVDEFCSFVEVPPNTSINDHLILTGNYIIRGQKRNIKARYDFGLPLESKIQKLDITGREAFNYIRGIIESYRYRICQNLDAKIAQLKV